MVTDPAGEIFDLTCARMKKRGYKVQVLKPASLEESLYFNPLAPYVETLQELKQIACTIGAQTQPETSRTGRPGRLISCIFSCKPLNRQPDRPAKRNLGELRRLLNEFGVTGENINEFLGNHLDDRTFARIQKLFGQGFKADYVFLSPPLRLP